MTSDPASRLPRGRPKGSKGKLSGDLKEMILSALHHSGGRAYLKKIAVDHPGYFVKLLSMLVPREISHSGVITGVTVQINTNMALGPGRAFKQIETQLQQEDLIPQIPQKIDPEDTSD